MDRWICGYRWSSATYAKDLLWEFPQKILEIVLFFYETIKDQNGKSVIVPHICGPSPHFRHSSHMGFRDLLLCPKIPLKTITIRILIKFPFPPEREWKNMKPKPYCQAINRKEAVMRKQSLGHVLLGTGIIQKDQEAFSSIKKEVYSNLAELYEKRGEKARARQYREETEGLQERRRGRWSL